MKEMQNHLHFSKEGAGLAGKIVAWEEIFANDDITLDEAKAAAKMCINQLEYMPSVNKFREMLAAVRSSKNQSVTEQYLLSFKQIKRSNPEVAESHLQKIKALLSDKMLSKYRKASA